MLRTMLTRPTDAQAEHDEETFRSLLDFEYERCLQCGQAFHVLLCRLTTHDGARFTMNASAKRALVSAMRESLGTTDQMGWFLKDRVLGALLVSVDPTQSDELNSRGRNEIRRHLERRLVHAHPSLIVQCYDYLDLAPVTSDVRVPAFARPC
ncbi:MAG: hypothetical protein HC938_03425 [Nitrospira sp.]|nr:hypothetical protein [Nitrospira sp.]